MVCSTEKIPCDRWLMDVPKTTVTLTFMNTRGSFALTLLVQGSSSSAENTSKHRKKNPRMKTFQMNL